MKPSRFSQDFFSLYRWSIHFLFIFHPLHFLHTLAIIYTIITPTRIVDYQIFFPEDKRGKKRWYPLQHCHNCWRDWPRVSSVENEKVFAKEIQNPLTDFPHIFGNAHLKISASGPQYYHKAATAVMHKHNFSSGAGRSLHSLRRAWWLAHL